MKRSYSIALFSLLLLCPVARALTVTKSTESPSFAAARASFHIVYATWGAKDAVSKKDHSVDVTCLATDLLLHQGSIDVTAAGLRCDPWPGQSKFLFIKYDVLGKRANLVTRARRVLTLARLFKHAGVIPADDGSDPGPAPGPN